MLYSEFHFEIIIIILCAQKNVCIIHNYSLSQINFTCSLMFNEILSQFKKILLYMMCIKMNKH